MNFGYTFFFSHKTFILLSHTKHSVFVSTGNTLNTNLKNDLFAQNLVNGFLLKKPKFMKIVFV